ncbi:sugar phosphate isomerase/epimerase family protein [Tenggerimyces flavus]|uniref:Sugar phosphate isomerase/epimerase family protein n=1 Tax=Tenggerimyces flavus TaxID=1708749 RepID=A0ABV7YA83_9ACTN|nr:sugar phosphate isomerase/epimerase family protein [Tenggerimyces flavus]MBM7785327.1 sugar phosphate isomerase/epimerase [Tenggerimyces flavus]
MTQGLERLSLNQKTTNSWSVAEAVDGCVRAGIPAIGLWREPVQAVGVAAAAKLVRDAGLRVSSLCRGGFLTASDPDERTAAVADNRLAIDEAAELGAPCLVLVVGGLPAGSKDLAGARQRVADAVAELVPYAASRGVRLALEPLHPMYCADRAVLSTLTQALDLALTFPDVGVAVDTFHLWWDPNVAAEIARAGERILTYQVCDFLVPMPADNLLARGMMGDGVIDFAPMTAAVAATGYAGDVEVEIFNADVWAADPSRVVSTMCERYLALVAPYLA